MTNMTKTELELMLIARQLHNLIDMVNSTRDDLKTERISEEKAFDRLETIKHLIRNEARK